MKLIYILPILLIFLLAGCAKIIETQEQHSEDYTQIAQTLKESCKARQTERWKEFLDQYSYDKESFEYKDLKKLMIGAFNTVNAADCEFTIENISFNNKKTKAEVFGRLYVTEMPREGFGTKSDIFEFPNEDGNAYQMIKKDDQWKICPYGKNCNGKFSPLYSCQNGEMIEDKHDCPFAFRRKIDISEDTFKGCFEYPHTIEQLIPIKLGDYDLNKESLKVVYNDSKIYKVSETSIDKFDIIKSIEGDYQHDIKKERILNMAYLQLGDSKDLRRYIGVIKQINEELIEENDGKIETTYFGDIEALYVQFKSVPRTKKLTTITRRYYLFFPESNVVLRFYLNDWLTDFNGNHIISNYVSNRCDP